MNRKIVITGMGAVTPIGIGTDAYWQALLDGKCGIEEMTKTPLEGLPVKYAAEVKNFRPRDYLNSRLAADLDDFMQYAYVSAEEALRGSGLMDENGLHAEPSRVGVVMGTALHGISHIAAVQKEVDEHGEKRVSPRFMTKIMGNIAAAQLAISHGLRGPSLTVSTACSSGGDAIFTACLLLESGMADVMVVMAGEAAECLLSVQSLCKVGALSKTGRSRPFDAERDGFVIGEGGGALILETEEHALARGAKIRARLLGCANNNDAFHPVSPEPDGAGAAECMRLALERAGLAPESIGYINAHGTATLKGDEAENAAIHSVFGSRRVPVSSTKGATGHMMGAGGVTEVIACVKAIETGLLPPNTGFTALGEGLDLNIVARTPEKRDITAAMSNALGFGGQNSSIIVGKYI